jgi:two-component system, OmpR family, copper resistance phosphate regulon response regulator CusR
MKLLIVEDDAALADMLRRGFEEEEIAVTVAKDGPGGLESAMGEDFDCVILDVMLPGLDGISICKSMRERGNKTPVLMLTVKSSVADKIMGLSVGADDYLTKPFSFEELLARVRALIRRHQEYADHFLHFADLEIDLLARKAVRAGAVLDLTPKEFALTEYLMRNAGRVVGEQELIEAVWGLSFDPQTNVLNVFLHHLRRKLDREGLPRLIQTVRGHGYRMGEAS